MKCRTCCGEMIQKSRLQLFVVGVLMIASLSIVTIVPLWWLPGIILVLTGAYLIAWASIGRGGWCRTCKKFSIVPN